ncbi:FG-GAP and VCBS repeat-containing protein [Streptomyces oceani]|uniref:FG-GAP and VCBS repeat-containing protein n=1 Tax=Streptomyces oceani TaxID=1075402 RepID=UPI000ADCC97F|nr:FG-GAP and VCBS repeat-containing protein [Streptomyces oceani]
MRKRTVRTTIATAVAAAAVAAAPVAWGAMGDSGAGTAADGGDSTVAKPVGIAPKADFNKDGHADLVSTAPKSEVSGESNAGYVAVTYGSADGTDPEQRQVISQQDEDVPGIAQANARFGAEAVARDLDGDGYTDLAVRVEKKNHDEYDGGAILMWGSDKGLHGGVYVNDGGNGDDLTGGDFNGDGKADLFLESGQQEGLALGPFSREGVPAKLGPAPEANDFTADTVAGDMTGDGKDDLVRFSRYENNAHPAQFYQGTEEGLRATDTRLPAGRTGALGDVDKDGYADLVMSPHPQNAASQPPNSVRVFYGSSSGPNVEEPGPVIDQDTEGVPGKKEQGDEFGEALDAGDVNGDGYADIAVGSPGETAQGRKAAGTMVLLRGGEGGLSGDGAQVVDQATPEVPGKHEAKDRFGDSTRMLDADNDGHADVAVGAPNENAGVGAAWVLRGGDEGVTTEARSFGPKNLGAPELRNLAQAFAR